MRRLPFGVMMRRERLGGHALKAATSRVVGVLVPTVALCVLAVVGAVVERPQPSLQHTPSSAPPLSPFPLATETAAPTLRIDRPGHSERVFDTPVFGRYAVRAVSPYGTALRLIDAMSGPGPEDGVPGKRDGRIDAFLDPGPHKVSMTLPGTVGSAPEIKADAFIERNDTPVALPQLQVVSTELQDLEQRSYWLDIRERKPVFIEAAGRRLADLRLWKDGTWLVDVQPSNEQVMARPGQPLTLMRMAVELDPGLYRLTAYGGPGLTWTENAGDSPLHLRSGIPTLAEGARLSATASPFGVDRWLAPKNTTAFHLRLPELGEAAIEASANFTGVTIQNGERASIDKKSRLPAADVNASTSTGHTLVTVERAAGEPYVLQGFNTTRVRTVSGFGWGAVTLTSSSAGDDVDLTAILAKVDANGSKVVASDTARLAPTLGWMRRFNLLAPVSLFAEVTEPGRYTVQAAGVDAEVAIDPAFPERGYKPKGSKVNGGQWDLDAGFHVVTLRPRPEGRGIVTLTLTGERAVAPSEPAPAVTAIDFSKLWLESNATYRLTFNQTGAVAGAQVRESLPVELSQGDLVAVLRPDETREIALQVPADGTLDAVTDDGGKIAFAIDGATASDKAAVTAGHHTAVIRNPGASRLRIAMRFNAAPAPATPLPPVDVSRLPSFPQLEAGTPRFLDLGRQRSATFALKVDKAALYRLESTGLLATSGTLRTQTAPSLARAAANGAGRNFLIQQYLRPGLYQLTVTTLDQSAGHLGLSLTATPLRLGGRLTPGVPARASLAAGEGVLYDVSAAETASWRLEAMNLGQSPELRLEDEGGWPLTNPGTHGQLTRELESGRYRLVVLPQPLPGRVVTQVGQVMKPEARQGHGPHALSLGETTLHRWEEPPAGGERTADTWTADLPADADVTFALGEGMEGRLERGDGTLVAEFNHLRPLARRLEAGPYRLAVRSIQPNNRLDYSLATSVRQLIAGTARDVQAPIDIPVSVGASGLVDIASSGGSDVRGTLYDSAGTMVANADDRADDWNFAIATRLPPGHYTLRVEPVGSVGASTLIRMRATREVEEAALEMNGERILADETMHLLPLAAAADEGLLVAVAQSADEIGLALEARDPVGHWVALGNSAGRTARLALPRTTNGTPLRLRVWSLDHTPTPISVTVREVHPSLRSESRLAEGVTLEAVPGLDPVLGVAAVRLDRPGLLRLEEAPAGLAASATADRRVLAPAAPIVTSRDGRLWLMGEANAVVKARRVLPPAEGDLAFTLADGEDVTIPVEGGGGPQLWLTDSRVGQPGITRHGGDPRASGWGDGQSVAVLAGDGDTAIHIWRADGGGALPLTLRRFSFTTTTKGQAHAGVTDGILAAGGALRLSLPAGHKRLRLALPPGTAAALSAKDEVSATLWAGAAGHSETLDSDADDLLLLNSGAEGRFAIDVSTNVAAPASASRNTLLSRWQPTEGAFRFATDGPLVLQASGAADTVRAVQSDGHVITGSRLSLTGEAMVNVRHRAGLIALWSDGDDAEWPAGTGAKPAPALPATVALSEGTAWAVEAAEPALLRLETANAVVVGMRRPGAPPDVRAWPRGAAAALFLPRGNSVIGLRALQDGPLNGTARLSVIAAAIINEGLGPKLRLAPGDARLFAFTQPAAGPVGVGVRGDADTARVHLLDHTGKVLASGATAMLDLAAGSYFLVVENRADAGTVEIQPALVGVVHPDTGPPEDVKRSYWQLVSEEREVR